MVFVCGCVCVFVCTYMYACVIHTPPSDFVVVPSAAFTDGTLNFINLLWFLHQFIELTGTTNTNTITLPANDKIAYFALLYTASVSKPILITLQNLLCVINEGRSTGKCDMVFVCGLGM